LPHCVCVSAHKNVIFEHMLNFPQYVYVLAQKR